MSEALSSSLASFLLLRIISTTSITFSSVSGFLGGESLSSVEIVRLGCLDFLREDNFALVKVGGTGMSVELLVGGLATGGGSELEVTVWPITPATGSKGNIEKRGDANMFGFNPLVFRNGTMAGIPDPWILLRMFIKFDAGIAVPGTRLLVSFSVPFSTFPVLLVPSSFWSFLFCR